jgi:DNA-binding response OmpR family regulator
MPWPFKRKSKSGFDPKDKTVLVVDDESDVRIVVETILVKHGYRVVQAKDGAEALQLLSRRKFDLVVLDIMMPRVDGYQVMEHMKSKGLEVPVVMLTAKGQPKDVWKGYVEGCHYYITKPFESESLIRGVNYLLSNLSDAQRQDVEPLM